LLYEIALTYIPGIGNRTAKKLLQHFGSAGNVFSAKKNDLLQIEGIRKNMVEAILNTQVLKQAGKDLELIEKYNIEVLHFQNPKYPGRLLNCVDAPSVLYYKGNADLNPKKVLAIVGTRKATAYGKDVCSEIIKDLPSDVLIVSGLAFGIDTCAHQKSLSNNKATVGVLGHGLDRIYPVQNRKLAEKMLIDGGLLTEFSFGSNPDRENFPRRNRIVAGMADAVLVIESAAKGGALITAEIANSYNRDVFAVPGRVGDLYSKGCHFLIRTNRAALVESANDILRLMNWGTKKRIKTIQRQLFITLNNEEQKIYDLLSTKDEMLIDDLAILTGWTYGQLSTALLGLELKGITETLPGNKYKII
jgi:DNA processing protein